jgi:6-pyruvoyltetrahydropterin/6-carboxytetrahydropterin synthase
MYRVSVQKAFTARHYLIGGDWGVENQLHAHPYRLEIELSGYDLDQHQYLVDIVAIENVLEQQIALVRETTLNDLPAFAGVNPSLEYFARWLCESLSAKMIAGNIQRVAVRLWENDAAWAGYELER